MLHAKTDQFVLFTPEIKFYDFNEAKILYGHTRLIVKQLSCFELLLKTFIRPSKIAYKSLFMLKS